jgi:hypothetical protein
MSGSPVSRSHGKSDSIRPRPVVKWTGVVELWGPVKALEIEILWRLRQPRQLRHRAGKGFCSKPELGRSQCLGRIVVVFKPA